MIIDLLTLLIIYSTGNYFKYNHCVHVIEGSLNEPCRPCEINMLACVYVCPCPCIMWLKCNEATPAVKIYHEALFNLRGLNK